MRLSKVRTQIRRKVSDPKPDGDRAQKWTDAHIDSYINLVVQSIYRRRADADSSFGLVHIRVSGDDATRVVEVTKQRHRYLLPSWVHTAAFVRQDNEAEGRVGDAIIPNNFEANRVGWYWEKDNAIIIQGFTHAPDVIFSVQRIPTPLHAGTIRRAGGSTSVIALDTETNIGDVFDPEDGAYLGSKIEVTGGQDTAGGTRDPRGRVCTVTAQARAWDGTLNAFITELTVQPPLPVVVAANDTYEMHVDLQSSEIHYLVLLVAEQLWQETNNVNALNGIRDDLEREERNFIDGMQPRDDMAPGVQGGALNDNISDEDRDAIWLGGGLALAL